jgi:flagellar protein FlaG
MKISPPDGSTASGGVTPDGPSSTTRSSTAAVSVVASETSRADLARIVEQANRQMGAIAPALEFQIDPDTEQVVIRLVDRQDHQVLRQVPTPEMLAIARALDRMQAMLLRTRA